MDKVQKKTSVFVNALNNLFYREKLTEEWIG